MLLKLVKPKFKTVRQMFLCELPGSSAPLKGTHMIMTEAYRRIVARAAHGQ